MNGPSPRPGDEGYVTAELALALPTLVVVLAAGLYVLAALSVQGRCVDAASAGARLLARGDDPAAVRRQLSSALPGGATVTFGRADPGLVTVRVETGLPAPGGLRGMVSAVRVHATSSAADEAADEAFRGTGPVDEAVP